MIDWSLILFFFFNIGEYGLYLWENGFFNLSLELDRRLEGVFFEGDLFLKGGGEEEV